MKLGSFNRIQQERRSEADRRSGADRRQVNENSGDAQRRETGDRRQGDRRKMSCGVRFATTRSITLIEEFLDAECKGDWHVVLDGIDDDLIKKWVRLMFEFEEDKSRFLERFRR